MRDGKVSVIIPTYNREKSIRKSVESVLNQTYSDLEVIVVDDCSTDNTKAVIESIKDERVRYLFLPENVGPAKARNEGVKAAACKWIAFHDSDDCWIPQKLEKQMKYLDENRDCLMVYCGYKSIYEEGLTSSTPDRSDELPLMGDIFIPLLLRNTIGAPTVVIDKEKFLELGGFDETWKCLEDWEFAVRFSKDNKIGFVDEDLVEVSIGFDGVSSNIGEYFKSRCRFLGMYKDIYIEQDLLQITLRDIITRASNFGVLSEVEKMLTLYLS